VFVRLSVSGLLLVLTLAFAYSVAVGDASLPVVLGAVLVAKLLLQRLI
jgi:hypothetical protein